ncbi:MAG: transposase [Candidatus Accumulibacter sp.]|uniref:transposase n=1 Tax=Accumulibacter sp. TaxID=2053492 RepID=UPI0025857BA8|nr:transposase [Accumulibacter sp.]MBK8115938.1 transposase [Accumulibacter sp.]
MPVTELSLRLLQLVLRVCPTELVTLILDDTLVPRCAEVRAGDQHQTRSQPQGRSADVLNSQCWVTLALVVRVRLGSALTVPIRSWLLEESGQRGKLWVARHLMDRSGAREGGALADRCLVHEVAAAWFCPLLEQQVRIIGQVRRDTALFLPPEPEPKCRGPKRKYGQRVDVGDARNLADTRDGTDALRQGAAKRVRVRYRSSPWRDS